MDAALKIETRQPQDRSYVFHLRPFAEAAPLWSRTVATLPNACVYHRPRWLELLGRSYGLHFWIATAERDGAPAAAAVLARSKRPFSHRLVALPFSDFCPPLAADESALAALINGLLEVAPAHGGLEVRGLKAPEPWKTVRCFENWTLNLAASGRTLERELHQGFRAKVRRASRIGIRIERGWSADLIERFYAMQLRTRRRLGLPVQPLRFYRLAAELFGPVGELEAWIASYAGRDVAGLVILRDHDQVHYKWGARNAEGPPGASHLLMWSLVEEFGGRTSLLHLGRTDVRNTGLIRFKKGLGGKPEPLPHAFFPKAASDVSAEVTSGARLALSAVWRHLPLGIVRVLGSAIYAYLE